MNRTQNVVEGTDEELKPRRSRRLSHAFVDSEGQPLHMKTIPKFQRDIIAYENGMHELDGGLVTVYDVDTFIDGGLHPGLKSPICQKCQLLDRGAKTPFAPYTGAENPTVTIILDSVSIKEDDKGAIGSDGASALLKKIIRDTYDQHGVDLSELRFVPLTRCANRGKGLPSYKAPIGWCRDHAVADLREHPPKLIMPVGSVALGALSYKSNAQDWGGRLLTWRGWPDDWLTDKAYMDERHDPTDYATWQQQTSTEGGPMGRMVVGHPIFGQPPETRIPMLPIQTPRLVYMMNNPHVLARWKKSIVDAMKMAKSGVTAKSYIRPWYRVTEDANEIECVLRMLLQHPGILLCYDTETTGLKPLAANAAVVFMMFRWVDPETNEPRSIGFPWDFSTSLVKPHIRRLAPLVLQVLGQSTLLGHNLTFDVLYTHFAVPHPDLDNLRGPELWRAKDDLLVQLANAAKYDTWHMRYVLRQERGSLGLEILVYDHCPELAGYEEDMTLLIELNGKTMNPAEGMGGHYAMCPREKWDTHLVPYVMGDVEGCYGAYVKISEKLSKARTYRIPLAHPTKPGHFRLFTPPARQFVYDTVMSPASQVLMKLMGRGMNVNVDELEKLEKTTPASVKTQRDKLRNIDAGIVDWCEHMHNVDAEWEFDLESKEVLKHVLFDILDLPVQRLTKTGKKYYGEEPDSWDRNIRSAMKMRMPGARPDDLTAAVRKEFLDYAALDKFTLNKLAVDHEQVRPLQAYRKEFKLWSTYIRPLRNAFDSEIDTKKRDKEMHLCSDGCVHAQFMLTGTRGGRLSCRDPNLQQLPRKGEAKKMYTSRFGERGCLYQADLSQIELRLLAAGCGDPTMVKAYFDNTDLHSLTASRIYKIPYEHFTKDYFGWLQKNNREKEAKELEQKRSIAKTTNFLTGYGGGAFGLQTTLANNQVYLALEECEKIIDSFFDSYPALQRHLQYYKRFIMDNGVACSLFGRVRVFEEVFGEDKEFISKALRAGCNHLIQATASDMMLVALIVIESLMRDAQLESMLVSTVHDSLLIDAVRPELPKIHEIVDEVLNNFHEVLPAYFGPGYDTSWMIVPFAGDSEVGLNYLDMQKVLEKNPDWDKLLAPEHES